MIKARMKIQRVVLTAFALFAITGCATSQNFTKAQMPETEMQSVFSGKPAELREDYSRLATEGERNEVLNNMRLGLHAYDSGHKELAAEAFDRALLAIESVYADNESARKARSLWYEEGMKDFKGEPYERAMLYYYRGMLLLEERDYENARASFTGGILQDAFAEEEQNRSDFALLVFLAGFASELAKDQELARGAYDEFKKLRPTYPVREGNNALIIVETGNSPRKVADGMGHSELKYRRGKNFTEKFAELVYRGEAREVPLVEDIYWQASSRGGRAIDKIVKGKAVFRNVNAEIGGTLADLGTSAIILAPLFSDTGAAQGVGATLSLVGVAQMAVSMRSRPHADTRYWDNLPDRVHIFSADLTPGNHRFEVRYKDDEGRYLPELTDTLDLEIEDRRPVILRFRSR